VSEFQYTNSMIMFYISSPLNNLFSSTNYLFYHRGESFNKIVFYLHTWAAAAATTTTSWSKAEKTCCTAIVPWVGQVINMVDNKYTLILWLPHMNAWIQEYSPLREKLCLLVLRLTFYLDINQQSGNNQGHVTLTNGSPCLVEWKSRNIQYQAYNMLRSFSFF